MKQSAVLSLVGLFLMASMASAATPCQPFTFVDNCFYGTRTLTAALVNPQGPVTGDVDATGCDVGVFYGVPGMKGLVRNATIHGAGKFGVLVAGETGSLTVDIISSSIYDVGPGVINHPVAGGSAISYVGGIFPVSGKITGSVISRYAMAGVFLSRANVEIADNIISARFNETVGQYGIFVGDGCWGLSKVTIERNTIVNNVYAGPHEWWEGYGIFGWFDSGSLIKDNVLVNNQYGIAAGGGRLTVVGNRITCDDVYTPIGRQLGLWLITYVDKVESNIVTGVGYDVNTKPGWTFPVLLEPDPRGKPR